VLLVEVEADPLLKEVMAAHLAINFCKKMGFTKIVCECDFLQVIKGICDPEFFYVQIGHFLEAIRQDAYGFSSCSWVHYCREANGVVHVLTREASSKCFSKCWFENMSLFISDVSYRDFLVSIL